MCLTSSLSPLPRGSGGRQLPKHLERSAGVRLSHPFALRFYHIHFQDFFKCKDNGWKVDWHVEAGEWKAAGGTAAAARQRQTHSKRCAKFPTIHCTQVGLQTWWWWWWWEWGIPIPNPLPLPLSVYPGALIWTMCRQIYSYSGLLA